MLITAAFVLFNRLFDLIGQLLRGVGRFTFEATLQGVGAVAFIAGSIVVMAAGYGVTAVLAVLCAKELVSAVVGYIALRADIEHPDGVRPRSDWKRLLSIGIRLSIAGIALAVTMRIPLALLGNVGTTTEVALFSAAQRFADAAYVLAWTGGFALLPGIAYLAGVDFPRARRLVHQVLFALIAASAVLAGLALALAEPLMRITFGSDFAEGADLLRIVLAGVPASTALGICWYAIVAFDGEARLLGIGLAGLAVCIVLSAGAHPFGDGHRRGLDLRRLPVRDGGARLRAARAPTRPDPGASSGGRGSESSDGGVRMNVGSVRSRRPDQAPYPRST